MSQRWTKWRITAESIVLLTLLYFYMHPEPTYRGETLKYWFDDWVVRNGYGEGELAFKEAGEKAVPLLLKKLTEKESDLHRYYRERWEKLSPTLQNWTPTAVIPSDNTSETLNLLGQLGPTAREAAPELIRRLVELRESVRADELEFMRNPPETTTFPLPIVPATTTNHFVPVTQVVAVTQAVIHFDTNALLPVEALGRQPVGSPGIFVISESIDPPVQVVHPSLPPVVTTLFSPTSRWYELVDCLSKIGSDQAESIPLLLYFGTASYDDQSRKNVANALGSTNFHVAIKTSVPVLGRALNSSNVHARYLAAAALEQLVPEVDAVTPWLAHALITETNSDTIPICIRALGRSTNYSAEVVRAFGTALPKLYFVESLQALNQLCSRTDQVIPMLLDGIKQPDESKNYTASWLLRHVRRDLAMPAMINALGGTDNRLRIKVANTLERMGSEAREAIPALKAALKDPDENVRRAAADALVIIDTDAAIRAGVK